MTPEMTLENFFASDFSTDFCEPKSGRSWRENCMSSCGAKPSLPMPSVLKPRFVSRFSSRSWNHIFMAAEWQPQEAGVQQLAGLLSEFQKPGTNQAQILQQLEQCKQIPDFNNYLAFIFGKAEQLAVEVRQSAGLLLKNNLKSQPLHPDATAYIKIIEDTPAQMEQMLPVGTAGAAPGVTVSASILLSDLLLVQMQSSHFEIREQSVACLNMLVRDMSMGMVDKLETYLQGLFALAHDQSGPVRREVCVGMVTEYMLAMNEGEDETVALESCEFWMAFCEAQLDPELLRPFLPRLIPVLMKNMVFDEYDEDVQDAEAAEAAAGGPQKEERDSELKPFHLKERDKGTEAADDDEDDDADGSSRWTLRKCSAAALDRLSIVYGDDLLPVLLPIVEQRLQNPDWRPRESALLDLGANTDWRARESALLALGAVSEGCHQGLLPHLGGIVTMLLPKMVDPRPMVRIISCWALSRYSHWLLTGTGSVHGVAAGLTPATTPEPVIKGVLERSVQGDAAGLTPATTLEPVIKGVLERVADPNKFVQESACSSLATLTETAANEECMSLLHLYVPSIIATLAAATLSYTRRNLRLVYDALSTLVDALGEELTKEPTLVAQFMPPLFQRLSSMGPQAEPMLVAQFMPPLFQRLSSIGTQFMPPLFQRLSSLGPKAEPMLVAQFMPPLFQRLFSIGPQDKDLMPLMECLTTLAATLGRLFEPYAPAVYEKCMGVIEAQVAAQHAAAQGQVQSQAQEYDKEMVVASLDLVSGMAEGVGPALEPLVGKSPLVQVGADTQSGRVRRGWQVGVGEMPRPRSMTHKQEVVASLDLVDGMAEGVGPPLKPLVGKSPLVQILVQCCQDVRHHMRQSASALIFVQCCQDAEPHMRQSAFTLILVQCCQDTEPHMRQSSFALVGDLCRCCMAHVAPAAPQFITFALANLEQSRVTQENMRCCNNACWAMGELAIKLHPDALRPCAEAVAEKMAGILAFTTRLPRSIVENCAITLGRVAWVCPEPIAPHLVHFCAVWCQALRSVRDDVEKEHAFMGLCALIRLNPEAALNSFGYIAVGVASWRNIACEGLKNDLVQLMQGLKQKLVELGQWQTVSSSLEPAVMQKLSQMCGI
eukprot:gene31863-7069_t